MRNSPRSGLTVAALATAALVGLSSDSAEGGKNIGTGGHGETGQCLRETQELARKLAMAEDELRTLRAQTNAQAEQVGVLHMQLEATEATCDEERPSSYTDALERATY